MSASTGIPWRMQELGEPMVNVFARAHARIAKGDFTLKSWDHNAKERQDGCSNKQVTIVGAALLDRREDPTLTYAECKAAFLLALTGRILP